MRTFKLLSRIACHQLVIPIQYSLSLDLFENLASTNNALEGMSYETMASLSEGPQSQWQDRQLLPLHI